MDGYEHYVHALHFAVYFFFSCLILIDDYYFSSHVYCSLVNMTTPKGLIHFIKLYLKPAIKDSIFTLYLTEKS